MRSTYRLVRDNIKCLKPCVHGGKVWEAEKTTNLSREEILDFSSSINPLGSSQIALEAIRSNLGQIPVYPSCCGRLEYWNLREFLFGACIYTD